MTVDDGALAAAVAAVLTTSYDLEPPVTCSSHSVGFNEHLRARSGTGEHHVRLYLDGKYYIGSDADLAAELAIVDSLADAGCPVARPVRRRDGGHLTVAPIEGRDRRLAVFERAAGQVGVTDGTTAEALGRAVASLHVAADHIGTSHRYTLDERYLLDQPLRELEACAGGAVELGPIADLAGALRSRLATLSREAPAFGLIHADLHLGNVLVADDGSLTILDFDHCGLGWRAYDLAPVRMSLHPEAWDRFLAGYTARAPLPVGFDALDDLVRARILWDVGDLLAMAPVWGTTEVGERVCAELPALVQRLGLR